MAKQLNVALDFTANTTQAKQQIQELQQLLTKVAYSTDLGIDPSQMKEASAAAKELAVHLNEAYNQKTGNYDLSKLNASLAKSKTSVTELSTSLLKAGTTGQQAFIKLAQSIAGADQPMITLNARLQDFLVTVKNSVKWQISSSMIHQIIGAVQRAYGYAQDLNESLNNIRIVTGHNIDYMDKFADKANKAAKALSTSTLNYTDASLIYYQQGLSDQEVEDRTAVTIKMANAAGESAEKISDQLTAVWNNFYDGSQSLEYYADVMTALGAATASSTDEISAGLEKFAAVSNAVGLSYEYATSALATVTATTRQSADVVGTAFKTLFARIQDLELGKTLDDGTTLGKYSQALETVGVSIKTADGGLREMDDILSDLGEKWNSFDAEGNPLISDDAKIALAQTVAGVRQYTQLIALMDNWDFMKENLETARNATGTLNEQQKIYEESWEAANKRLRASFESLYTDLIDDKFFIKFTDFLSDMVDGVDSFIDKIGGVKTLLIGILGAVGQTLSSRIQPAIDNIINNIQIMAGGANKVYGKIRNETNEQINTVSNKYNLSDYDKQSLQNVSQLNIMKQRLADQTDRLSDSERRLAEITIQGFEMSQQEILKTTKQLSEYKTQVQELKDAIPDGGINYSNKRSNRIKALEKGVSNQTSSEIDTSNNTTEIQILQQNLKELSDAAFNAEVAVDGSIKTISQKFMELGQAGQEQVVQGSEVFSDLISQLNPFSIELDKLSNNSIQSQTAIKGMKREIEVLGGSLPEVIRNSEAVNNAFKAIEAAQGPKELKKAIIELQTALKNTEINGKNVNQVLSQLGVNKQDIDLIVNGYKKISDLEGKIVHQQEELNNQLNNFNPKHLAKLPETFVNLASSIGRTIMSINSFKSAFESLKDPDLSGWEKASSFIISLSFALPMLYNAIKTLITGFTQLMQILGYTSLASNVFTEATNLITMASIKRSVALELEKHTQEELNDEEKKSALIKTLVSLGLTEETAKTIIATFATEGFNAALKVLNGELNKIILKFLAFLGPIVAVITAITAVGFAIYTLIKRSQSFNTELKQSNEDLQTLQDNLDGVNSEVQQVTSSLDGLSSKYDTFKDLKYGTVEWREALYDINDEVQGLIDKYNDLKEGVDYYRDSLGALHLTESGETKIRKQVLEKQNKAQTAVRAQENRDNELKRQTKINQIVADNQNVNIGTKKVQNQINRQGTKVFTGTYHTEKDYASLSENSINKVVQAAIDNADFDWSQESLTQIAELDERTAKLITTSRSTREALEDLTTETIKLRESYENEIFNELLARGLNLSEYDEKYRNGVGKAIASDVNTQEQAIIAERSQEGNKLTENEILTLLENQGIAISSLSENWFDDLIHNNKTVTAKKKDEETGYASDEEITIDYDTLVKNFAAEAALEWGLDQQGNYFDEQKYSQQAYSTADSLKSSWDAQNFNSDVINTEVNERNGGYVLGETKRVQDFLNENTESFSDIFGLSEEDFKDWASDINNVKENFGELQKAIEGDTGAINTLRDRMGSLGTHGQELVDKLAEAFEGFDAKTKKYLARAYDSKNFKIPDEAWTSINDFVINNADQLSDLAGVSKDTFISMYNNADKKYAKKVAKLLSGVTKGNKKDLQALAVETQRAFYTTGDNMNQAISNVQKNWNSVFSQMGVFANSEAETIKTTINSAFDDILTYTQRLEAGLEPHMDISDIKSALNSLIAAFGLTQAEAQKMVASFGFSAEFDPNPQEITETEKAVVYTDNIDEHGHHLDPPYVVSKTYTSKVQVPTITTLDYEGQSYGGDLIGPSNSGNGTDNEDNGENGGGGGGYTAPPPKEYKDEIERYHVIKQKIEDLQEVMDHLAKAKDRAFGTSKLELMDQEIEKYNEMIDLQNQYLDEINKYWEEDRALIASYGAEFDETGVITNYDEIMKRQIDKYNSSIGKNEEADEAAEEAYDDFIEALEQYEETNNLRQDELEKLYDLQTELADVIFEKTQYKIEIKIAVKDDELEYLDYLLSKIEDDAYSAAEAIALIGEKAENALEKTKTYSDGLMELLSNHGINSIEELDKLTVDDLKAKNFTEDEIDQIREWRSSILEANQELLEMRATIQEKVLDSFNQFSEDIQDQIDLFEHYQNILEGVKDITSLLGAQLNEQSKLVLRNLNRSLINNSINNLAGAKQQVEILKQMRANAQEQYDKAVANEDSIGIKQWSDTLKEIDDQVHSAEENFLDTWQEALERARDIFEEEMDNIVKEFEDGVSPIYGSIEALQDAITRANELNDQYLSDTDKTYELNKLRRQIEGSIDDTDIIPHKQALNKLQDELNKKLKDGSKISEYDLKILQSKYELELARQKLEDVQNSNETVRLTRDNNGNWGYVYSANEDKIAEAEQEYEDKLNAYQKANEEYLRTLENNIIQLQSDYQEKLTAIRLSFVEGEISQAEYEKQAADLEKYYNERMQQIHQQYEEVFKNSKDANEKFVAYYKDSSGALVDSFDQTALALQTGYQTLDEMFEKFWKSHNNYVADSNKLLDDYLNKIKEINSAAGIEGSFADAASGWSIKITGESDKAVADMEKIVKNATDSFNDVIKAASDWESIYVSKIDSAIKRNEALVKTMNEMVAALSGMNSIDYSKYENAIDSRSTATANNIISTQHNSESFNKTIEVPDYISQLSYLDMLDQLDMNKQIEDWMSNNELSIDTALMDSLDISTILQNIGLNVQTIVSYLSNLIPSSLGVDRIAQEFMQQVSINADFPNVTDSNEIMEAFEIMENEASQYANRKTI